MSLSPKKIWKRVVEKETSYCNDNPLVIVKGIRKEFLIVMPFWLVVSYLVI
ncbi:hypothetical protein ORM92_23045 [Bacillus cereus]|uniref:hypothetical protein n=1 Tax=Bacillus cereus TaxID=1396 RepID=UPI002AC1A821|nr:hypothetical protein [Bacillus cereus]MDZ4406732.1 hypothetical protein [Bacillus cereus]MDZ4533968.1 hypothetical protein [Bacillus cereus]